MTSAHLPESLPRTDSNFLFLFTDLREKGRERETSDCCCVFWCTHWLLLCARTGDQNHSLGVSGQRSDQLSRLARAFPSTFSHYPPRVLKHNPLHDHIGWGKSRLTVVHGENNIIINNNTRINSVFHVLTTVNLHSPHPVSYKCICNCGAGRNLVPRPHDRSGRGGSRSWCLALDGTLRAEQGPEPGPPGLWPGSFLHLLLLLFCQS